MNPLWYVKYDPARTKVLGKNSMRHSSKMFDRLSDAMAYAKNGAMKHGFSFAEYAVIRHGEKETSIVVQGSTEFEF